MANIIIMPKLGFDMAEGTLIRWLKAEGESVAQGEVIAEIETDKATVEVESGFSGIFRKQIVEEGTSVPIGSPIAVVGDADEQIDLDSLVADAEIPTEDTAEAPADDDVRVEVIAPEAEQDGNGHLPGGVRASPVARRLARDLGINLKGLTGTGQGGRIVKSDIEAYVSAPAGSTPTPGISLPVPQMAESTDVASVEIPLSKLRGLIGRRMSQAKQNAPHFYLTSELDAEPLVDMRSEMNMLLPEDEKISVNDFIIKAAALSLRTFPNLNASLSEDKIIRHGEINIGIAVAVDDGLLTVVVRDVDKKPLQLIAQDARGAIQRARAGRVQPDDVQGSTFTVSNLGMFDIENFIAIINPPEAAILAVGTVADVPVVKNNAIAPGKRIKVTLSADHRVTDGAEAARWMQVFRELIEHPLRLLF
jgi:pyruvate dehydrogenase E2 component (dihydrolipoamide acetyltransferase)